MSKNYFQKTAVYNAERYSAVFMKKHLLFYPYLINIFNIIALKKMKFLFKTPYQYFRRKFALYYTIYRKNKAFNRLDQDGYAEFNLNSIPGGKEIFHKYREIYESTKDNGTQYIMDNEGLWKDDELVNFATREEILAPIGKYLGTAPTLHALSMWRSKPDDRFGGPFFHLDSLDTKCIRLFIYLSDVDDEAGPVAYIPKVHSKRLAKKIGYLGGSMSDKKIFNYLDPNQAVIKTGTPGSMFTLDSTNCFHMGSRCLSKERAILHLSYASFHNHDELEDLKNYKNKKSDISLSSLSKHHISCF